MKILVCNDDGISSEGLYELAKSVNELGDVYVVAPEREQSATGHAITLHHPLRCMKIDFFDTQIPSWWVSGTPSDCIKLGIEAIIKEKPDLVVSGINKGENLGTDVLYSGTVSAAIEGAIFGIPSIAFSYASHTKYDFGVGAKIAKAICKKVIEEGLPENTVLNVNIPCCSIDKIQGYRFCELGVRKYTNNFEERKDPRGKTYYWLAGELINDDGEENTDIHAIKNNYVSITPIHIDLTNRNYLKTIKNWVIEM